MIDDRISRIKCSGTVSEVNSGLDRNSITIYFDLCPQVLQNAAITLHQLGLELL